MAPGYPGDQFFFTVVPGICGYSVWYSWILSMILVGTQCGTLGYSVWYSWVLSVVPVDTQYGIYG